MSYDIVPREIWALIASLLSSPGRLLQSCTYINESTKHIILPLSRCARAPTIIEVLQWLQQNPNCNWLSNIDRVITDRCSSFEEHRQKKCIKGIFSVMMATNRGGIAFASTAKQASIYRRQNGYRYGTLIYVGSKRAKLYVRVFGDVSSCLNITLDSIPLYQEIVTSRLGNKHPPLSLLYHELERQAQELKSFEVDRMRALLCVLNSLESLPSNLIDIRMYLRSTLTQDRDYLDRLM